MTKEEIHTACYKAARNCPQMSRPEFFQNFSQDALELFRPIAKKDDVLSFWVKTGIFFKHGYVIFLPKEVLKEFDKYARRLGHKAFSQ